MSSPPPQEVKQEKKMEDPYTAIEPLTELEISNTPPLRLWYFKPKYHLTMGKSPPSSVMSLKTSSRTCFTALENLPLLDLIAMDSTFTSRMQLRRRLMDDHPAETKQCNPVAEAAVLEFYDWMVRTYLPGRFPTVYELITGPTEQGLLNKISNTHLPLTPESPEQALDTLGEHVDTDFLFLIPSTNPVDGSPIYHLEAFVTCFPSGFSTREKCGKPLASIHTPVPGYKAKLEKSMDRFFAKIETGKAVKRANWSITTNDLLYSVEGNHMYADEDGKQGQHPVVENAKTLDVHAPDLDSEIARQRSSVVIEECRLRCERQTLHRLPKTKALVFAFKTYQYRLSEVKEAGVGLELANAIDGLERGNVPEMAFYKRQVVWGGKVKGYLLG
jgi:hypothetical protein